MLQGILFIIGRDIYLFSEFCELVEIFTNFAGLEYCRILD